MIAAILLALGVLLIVVGVWFVYWPAALIVAGAAAVTAALLYDFDTIGRPRKGR